MLHVFGTGHSHILAEEAFYRAGGLAAINPILDRRLMFFDGVMASTQAERETGYAGRILEREDVRAGDAAIVASNSGRNAVPIEMAVEFQRRGVKVIAIASLTHSRAGHSRHALGRRLFEIADIVIDTRIPAGDAAIAIPGSASPNGTALDNCRAPRSYTRFRLKQQRCSGNEAKSRRCWQVRIWIRPHRTILIARSPGTPDGSGPWMFAAYEFLRRPTVLLEVIPCSVDDALEAERGGAGRLEVVRETAQRRTHADAGTRRGNYERCEDFRACNDS